MIQKNNWCLFTYFKNKLDYLESFVNYYNKFWGINKFFFAFGYSDELFLSSLKKRISQIFEPFDNRVLTLKDNGNADMSEIKLEFGGDSNKKPSLDLLTYKTKLFSKNHDVLHNMKIASGDILKEHLSEEYNKIFNVDSDEYYYSNDVEKIKKQDFEIFHFIEFFPQKKFNIKEDWKWCLQPWYYSSHFDKYAKKLQCKGCKKMAFDRAKLGGRILLHHTGSGGETCKKLNIFNPGKSKSILLNGNFCFHMAVLDKEHLLNSKINQGFKASGGNNYELFDDFEKEFMNTKYPIIKENLLKKYWVNKEI